MVSFERTLFDINEAFQHMGILATDKYITETTVAFATLITFIAVPLIIKLNEYITSLDSGNKYAPLFIIGSIFILLYISEYYSAILIALILINFYQIIDYYPKYKKIKNYIDRFF